MTQVAAWRQPRAIELRHPMICGPGFMMLHFGLSGWSGFRSLSCKTFTKPVRDWQVPIDAASGERWVPWHGKQSARSDGRKARHVARRRILVPRNGAPLTSQPTGWSLK